MRISNVSRATELGNRVGVADTRWLRLRGLLGRPEPRPGEGLLIEPSRAVHMYGMKYALDVIFIRPDGRVQALYPGLAPWSRSERHPGARYALELPVGTIERTNTREGDELEWIEAT